MPRQPYFWVRHFPARWGVKDGRPYSVLIAREYWLVDFRSGNHRNVFNGQRWHSHRAALHAIALVDPTGQHRIVETW